MLYIYMLKSTPREIDVPTGEKILKFFLLYFIFFFTLYYMQDRSPKKGGVRGGDALVSLYHAAIAIYSEDNTVRGISMSLSVCPLYAPHRECALRSGLFRIFIRALIARLSRTSATRISEIFFFFFQGDALLMSSAFSYIYCA